MPNGHPRDRIENLPPKDAIVQLAISQEEAVTELIKAREDIHDLQKQVTELSTRQLKQAVAILVSLVLLTVGVVGNLVTRAFG